ncbi:MAG: aminomethyl-transferring glycine dehydrogenase subunit GcvPB [Candidatus Saganbacteria bacterium]|nr:aminomethyl-transferring glycine dehydrogenase subunit GcvPB [Candidatus Saganbacteria bacterium]
MQNEPLIFELSSGGRSSDLLPEISDKASQSIPQKFLREKPPLLPEISEVDLVRHFTNLSRRNFGVDTGFYPLGSCTMKYNPKINEEVASLEGFSDIHPLEDESRVQGTLELLYNFEKYMCSIFGFDAFTLAPAAGAHGELTAVLMAKKYFRKKGQLRRNKVLIPDSAHGTNPSSAGLAGFEVVSVKSDKNGGVDITELKRLAGPDTALMMLTNPNTLGLFDRNILEIADIVHKAGALFYMDGANANAILGKVKPTSLGFDMAHINLHKTFSTPHGGGGPGSGPVGVTKELEPFLPVPRIMKDKDKFIIKEKGFDPSIGKVSAFYGNVGVIIKAYAYIRSLGGEGLKAVSENAVLNANYIMNALKKYYFLPYERTCQHEFVISAKWQKEKHGIKALDIAKRLIDYGFHPPTIYFPLIVEEAMMIEPTETESKETLDKFIDAMISIAKECENDPELVKSAPHSTVVGRLDEVKAVKDLNVRYKG